MHDPSTTSPPSVASDAAATTLKRGTLRTHDLVAMVIGTQVPLGSVVALVPLALAFGVGVGAPGVWLVGGLVLIAFSVGWSRMSHHVTNTGAFYAYISRGLGIPSGIASAIVAVVAYNAMTIAAVAIFGDFASTVMENVFGIALPWPLYTGLLLVLIGVIVSQGVELSAALTRIAVIVEILMLLALSVAVLVQSGLAAFTTSSFAPDNVVTAGFGVTIAIAIWASSGFEAAAVYGEEAKEPRKSVGRASYLAILTVTIIYVLSTWTVIAGAGADDVVELAQTDPGGLVFGLFDQYLGSVFGQVVQVWSLLSIWAACMGAHNLAARYTFVLGRETVLPAWFAKTRPGGSPWNSSLSQLVFMAVVLGAFAVTGSDPYLVLGSGLLGLSVIGIATLMAAASASIIIYFRRWHREANPLTTAVIPFVALCGLVGVIVAIFGNYAILSGFSSGPMTLVPWTVPIVAVAVLGYVLILRKGNPERYRQLGRNLDRGAPSAVNEDANVSLSEE